MLSTASLFVIIVLLAGLILIESQISVGRQMVEVKVERQK